jgi:hypothetical protein
MPTDPLIDPAAYSLRPAVSDRDRAAPLGILLLAGLFAFLGLGSLGGGVYLLIETRTLTSWAALTTFGLAPALLYLAYHLYRLRWWTWLSLVVLVALLFVSTLVRLLLAPGWPLPVFAEIAGELAVAYYLTRPGVRTRFV